MSVTKDGHACSGALCLCHVVDGPPLPCTSSSSVSVEEIYQVLGRDVLKSSLIDDIDLYLECDDDCLYTLPQNVSNQHQMDNRAIRIQLLKYLQQQHVLSSNGDKRFDCEKCAKSFTHQSLMKDHLYRAHGVNDQFSCRICGYKGNMYRHLQKHIHRMHRSKKKTKSLTESPGEKNKKANNDKIISKEAARTTVKEITQPYKDQNNCQEAKTPNPLLDKTVETNGACLSSNTDGTVNMGSSDLVSSAQSECAESTVDLRDNETDDPLTGGTVVGLTCTQCNMTVHSKKRLREHYQVVHGDKLYQCSHQGCIKRFSALRYLRHHEAVHTEKFKCTWDDCNKCFRDQHNLKIHMSTHTQQKNIVCHYCDYTCIQRSSLTWHLKKCHKN